MTQAPERDQAANPFGPKKVIEKEGTAVAARRSASKEAFLTPSPTCYVKSVDRALKARDQVLAKYFRAVDSHKPKLQDYGLAGLALSGGGVRSATFNLGVLQGLHELGILQKLDYLSTVSGGGYIGCGLTAYVSAAQQEAFPFCPRDDEGESFVLRHLRQFSSYLVARGWLDALAAALTGLGGTLANLVILVPYLLVLAVLAVIQIRLVGSTASTWIAVILVCIVLLVAFGYALAQAKPGASTRLWTDREVFGRRTAIIGGIALLGAAWMIQPVLLKLIGDMPMKMTWQKMAATITGGGLAASTLSLARVVMTSPMLRRPVLAALLIAVMLALLWLIFVALGMGLLSLERAIGTWEMAVAGLVFGLLLIALGWLLPTNLGSLHGFYRDRLSKAYFFKPRKPQAQSLEQFDDCQLSEIDVKHSPLLLINACLNVSDRPRQNEDLRNEYVRPGRRGTFFLFSRHAVGNDSLGYVSASEFERENELQGSLATAMAISGAAFGANMGYNTNTAAVFLLTLLNVRTGCWVRFPRKESSVPRLQRLLGDYAYLTLCSRGDVALRQ